jgi:hypothetical protein
MIFGACYGFLWFLNFLCIQMVIVRKIPTHRWLIWNKRLLLISILSVIVTVGPLLDLLNIVILVRGGWPLGALWGVLTLFGLYVIYMPFYYVILTSLSVRTLVMLHDQEDCKLPRALIRMPFISEEFVIDRLDIMTKNGFLKKSDSAYAITRKGELVAHIFMFLKAFWRLGPGG